MKLGNKPRIREAVFLRSYYCITNDDLCEGFYLFIDNQTSSNYPNLGLGLWDSSVGKDIAKANDLNLMI